MLGAMGAVAGTVLNPIRGIGRGLGKVASQMPSRAGKNLGKAATAVEKGADSAAKAAKSGLRQTGGTLGRWGAQLATADSDRDDGDTSAVKGQAAQSVGRAKVAKKKEPGKGIRGRVQDKLERAALLKRGGKSLGAYIGAKYGQAKEGFAARRNASRNKKASAQQSPEQAKAKAEKDAKKADLQKAGADALSQSAAGRALLGAGMHIDQMGVGRSLLGVAKFAGIVGAAKIGLGVAALGGGFLPALLGLGLGFYVISKFMKGTGLGASIGGQMQTSRKSRAFFQGWTTKGGKNSANAYRSLGTRGERGAFGAGKALGIGLGLMKYAAAGILLMPAFAVETAMTGGVNLPFKAVGGISKAGKKMHGVAKNVVAFDDTMKGASTKKDPIEAKFGKEKGDNVRKAVADATGKDPSKVTMEDISKADSKTLAGAEVGNKEITDTADKAEKAAIAAYEAKNGKDSWDKATTHERTQAFNTEKDKIEGSRGEDIKTDAAAAVRADNPYAQVNKLDWGTSWSDTEKLEGAGYTTENIATSTRATGINEKNVDQLQKNARNALDTQSAGQAPSSAKPLEASGATGSTGETAPQPEKAPEIAPAAPDINEDLLDKSEAAAKSKYEAENPGEKWEDLSDAGKSQRMQTETSRLMDEQKQPPKEPAAPAATGTGEAPQTTPSPQDASGSSGTQPEETKAEKSAKQEKSTEEKLQDWDRWQLVKDAMTWTGARRRQTKGVGEQLEEMLEDKDERPSK
jgi:hypothetical protein